jgi:AcrR family transcriptional regulator
MARKYDGSRREAAAQKTREDILAAAFKLHGLGITDLEALAAEANVSVATVRKHFPTREMLFQGCTAYGMHLVTMPDLALIASIGSADELTLTAVTEVYALHEQLLGQIWTAFKYEHESPATAASIKQVDELDARVADIILSAWFEGGDVVSEARGFVLGILSPLSYRALRVHGGLSYEQAVKQSASALRSALRALTGKEAAYA